MLAFFKFKNRKFIAGAFCLLPTAYGLLITSSRDQMYQKYHES